MNWKLLSLLVITIYFSPLISRAQMIDSMMNIYSEKFPQEKVYMQFDKKAYNPGERIWYKAYVFTGFDPSPLVKIFMQNYMMHTEISFFEIRLPLLNLLRSEILTFRHLSKERAFISGHILPGCSILIRVLFIQKTFALSEASQDSFIHSEPSPVNLHFFPEGGEMVAGIENNIAFKASDSFGQPHKISGILYDQTGKALFNFNSTHDGMGNFILIPEKSGCLLCYLER